MKMKQNEFNCLHSLVFLKNTMVWTLALLSSSSKTETLCNLLWSLQWTWKIPHLKCHFNKNETMQKSDVCVASELRCFKISFLRLCISEKSKHKIITLEYWSSSTLMFWILTFHHHRLFQPSVTGFNKPVWRNTACEPTSVTPLILCKALPAQSHSVVH